MVAGPVIPALNLASLLASLAVGERAGKRGNYESRSAVSGALPLSRNGHSTLRRFRCYLT